MSSKSWKILESLTSRINKSPMLSSAIESAAGHAQVQITNIQNIATKKYDTIVKVYIHIIVTFNLRKLLTIDLYLETIIFLFIFFSICLVLRLFKI